MGTKKRIRVDENLKHCCIGALSIFRSQYRNKIIFEKSKLISNSKAREYWRRIQMQDSETYIRKVHACVQKAKSSKIMSRPDFVHHTNLFTEILFKVAQHYLECSLLTLLRQILVFQAKIIIIKSIVTHGKTDTKSQFITVHNTKVGSHKNAIHGYKQTLGNA